MAGTITILAVSGSPEVKQALQAWTASGLLRPSVWVERDELAKKRPTVMSTVVESIGRGATVTSQLREVLGTAAYRLIRIVSVRQVLDDTTDPELNELLATFTLSLRERVAETTTLLRINVVVPGDEEVAAKRLIDPDCDVNVVVSPEDRPQDTMVDHGLDETGVFDGHTALACATAGALWSVTEEGAFDEPGEFQTGNGGGVVVVRTFARVADCRQLPGKILPSLLSEGVTALEKYRTHRHNYVADDKKLIADAASAFVQIDRKAFCYRPRERPPVEEPPQRIRKTLRMLLQFWRETFGRRVLEWSHEWRDGLNLAEEQWLFDVTEGSGLRRMSPDETAAMASEAPDSLRDGDSNSMMPRTMPAEPQLWPPLRQLGFSLVDDGSFPGELADLQKLRPGVSHPSWVAAPPDTLFVVDDATAKVLAGCGIFVPSLRPADTFAADRLLDRLRAAELAVQTREGLARERRTEQLHLIRRCQEELEKWLERNHGEHSLIGHLVHHVADEIKKAQAALVALRKEYAAQQKLREDALGQLERIRGRLLMRLSTYVGIGVFAGVGFAAALLTGFFPLGIGVLAVAGVAVSQHGVFRLAAKASRHEDELAWVEARRARTVAAVKRWPGEAERLGALYSILLDWGEIIGWMLHRPFAFAETGDGRDGGTPRRSEAFSLGLTRIDDSAVHDLAAAVTRDVFAPGWIGELYRVVLDAAVPAHATAVVPDAHTDPDRSPAPFRPPRGPAEENTDDSVVPEPEPEKEDVPPAHARERLLRAFRALECGSTAGARLTRDIEKTLLTMPPDKLLKAVVVEEEGLRLAPAVEFLTAALPKPVAGSPCPQLASTIFSERGRLANRGKVVRVHLWGIANQLLKSPGEQVTLHRGGAAEGSVQYQFSVVRLDMSAGCEVDEVRLPG